MYPTSNLPNLCNWRSKGNFLKDIILSLACIIMSLVIIASLPLFLTYLFLELTLSVLHGFIKFIYNKCVDYNEIK